MEVPEAFSASDMRRGYKGEPTKLRNLHGRCHCGP